MVDLVDLVDLFDLVDLNGSGVDFYSVACQNVNEVGKLGSWDSFCPSFHLSVSKKFFHQFFQLKATHLKGLSLPHEETCKNRSVFNL